MLLFWNGLGASPSMFRRDWLLRTCCCIQGCQLCSHILIFYPYWFHTIQILLWYEPCHISELPAWCSSSAILLSQLVTTKMTAHLGPEPMPFQTLFQWSDGIPLCIERTVVKGDFSIDCVLLGWTWNPILLISHSFMNTATLCHNISASVISC